MIWTAVVNCIGLACSFGSAQIDVRSADQCRAVIGAYGFYQANGHANYFGQCIGPYDGIAREQYFGCSVIAPAHDHPEAMLQISIPCGIRAPTAGRE